MPAVFHPLSDEDGTQTLAVCVPNHSSCFLFYLDTSISQLCYFSGHNVSCDLIFKEGARETADTRLGGMVC